MLSENDSGCDTFGTLGGVAQQPDEALSYKSSDNKKKSAKQIISAEMEDDLINWIRETPYLYQKRLYTVQHRNIHY